ncbi:paraquat-inducible protein A [Alkalicaulis satelles]|uniref:Paraquat-inducible protein A n=1 Tax=Alkalicaulis satelles TaxID=2609175 RepID=A0A5M6ZIU4_9PROT|nr:paraquat-inducible protein A [Alkalicaulis satelles]KAA5804732.1 paraquat-inducible protein A [Alkalicaulis satelles]
MSDAALTPLSRKRPAGGALARALLALGVIFFPLGVTLPVMETTRFWIFKDSYSLIAAVAKLLEAGEWRLGAVIAAFSLGAPVMKMIMVAALHARPAGAPGGWLARWVERLGKWSLTDVLVVALLIVIWSGGGMVAVASQPGLWFFALSAVCLMLASGLIVRDLAPGRSQA